MYLVSFQVDELQYNEAMFNHVEQEVLCNKAMFQSLIYRCKYSEVEFLFVNEDSKEQSMLIKDEKVESILEYAVGKMIVSVYPTDILIAHDWTIAKIIRKL